MASTTPFRRRTITREARGRTRRTATRALAGVLGAGLLLSATPALADEDAPPGRKLVPYTVRPGDTATSLAVEHHAWTAELISHNGLGGDAGLHVGQRIEIPVVLAALPDGAQADPKKGADGGPDRSGPSREKVRRLIARTASAHGVGENLALAVSWQEAGWQMHHVSDANAVGAMQVLPSTGDWMSFYAGHVLDLHDTRDNVLAGVLLLRFLGDETRSTRRQIASYYQGLGAVREHGLYKETKEYVANVQAIRHRLEKGLPPG